MKTERGLTEQLLTCSRACPAWQECGIWLGRAPGITPARHCDWWPNGMPHTNAAANVVYVRHLEKQASVAPRAVPVDDEDIGLPAAWAFACLTLVVAGLVVLLGGRWLGMLG